MVNKIDKHKFLSNFHFNCTAVFFSTFSHSKRRYRGVYSTKIREKNIMEINNMQSFGELKGFVIWNKTYLKLFGNYNSITNALFNRTHKITV